MKQKTTNKRNTLNVLVVCIMLMATLLTACGSSEAAAPSNEAETTKVETAKAKETEPAAPAEVEEVAEVEPTAEPTPEPTTEPVEMVSWEEWASQPGEEEPHLVVWNEEKGKQLIIEPRTKYIIEEGDKLAVSFSMPDESVDYASDVSIRSENTGDSTKLELVTTEYGIYWDVIISEEGVSDVHYNFNNESYMYYIVKE